MLPVIGLLLAGFLLGALLAGIAAAFVIGVIHREAASIVDSHMFAMAGTFAVHSEHGDGKVVALSGFPHANR
ncbi:MAG: hypothetical protein WCZ66_03310 [Sphingomonadaceae bacterium]